MQLTKHTYMVYLVNNFSPRMVCGALKHAHYIHLICTCRALLEAQEIFGLDFDDPNEFFSCGRGRTGQ